MPNRNYRRRGYQKRNVFSRPRGQYRAPRAYGRNPAKWGRERTVSKRENGGDVKLTVGRRLIWIYNNTEDEVVIRPGEYIVLEIASEYENHMGLNIRAVVAGDGRTAAQAKEPKAPEERPQDWV